MQAVLEFRTRPRPTHPTDLDLLGKSYSLRGLMVEVGKGYCPSGISNPIEFIAAFVVSFYIIFWSYLLGVRGKDVVGRPKLTVEYNRLSEITAA
jgi:hypothetical protein